MRLMSSSRCRCPRSLPGRVPGELQHQPVVGVVYLYVASRQLAPEGDLGCQAVVVVLRIVVGQQQLPDPRCPGDRDCVIDARMSPADPMGVLVGEVLRVHHQDVGGMAPGSIPTNATEIYQEGLRIPPLRYIEAGKVNETLDQMLRFNIRLPETFLGDLNAQLAACNVGARRVTELCGVYGADTITAIFERLLDRSEAMTRAALRTLINAQRCFVPAPHLIRVVNRQLRGWANYFRFGYPRGAFRAINTYTRQRLTQHLSRRSQRPFRPPKGVTHHEHLKRLGLVYL